MTKFQLGDKVKFLNQTGGGIVTRVTDDFVFVQDDTGFDIPMDPKELIRMADMHGAGKMFNEAVEKTLPTTPAASPSGKPAVKPIEPEEEVKQLRSQVANLKDQVAHLQRQLQQLRQHNAQQVADNVLQQHLNSDNEAEVDLHIEQLAYNHAEMPAHEVFATQMRYFRRCMNDAVAMHIGKVVFIHGVGRGFLRDEIVKELKLYENIAFMDAPSWKYGSGAIEVYFK